MTVCALTAYVGFLLGGSTAVGARDILLLLCLGLYLWLFFFLVAFRSSAKGNAAHDDGVDVVSSKHSVVQVSQAQLEAIGYRLQTTGLLGVVQVSQAQLEAIGYRLQATGLLGVVCYSSFAGST